MTNSSYEMNDIRLTVLDTFEVWQQFASTWNGIMLKSEAPSLFLSYEFLTAAWLTDHCSSKLQILLVHKKDQLLGIAPLKITPRRILGILSNTVQPIATEVAENDFFIVASHASLFYNTVVKYLHQISKQWEKLNFFLLKSDHPFFQALRAGFTEKYNLIIEEHKRLEHHHVMINQKWNDYFSSLKPKFQQKLKSAVRKLCNEGTVQVVRYATEQNIVCGLNNYLRLENHSWKTRMSSGISRTGNLLMLHELFLQQCARNRWSEITFLLLDGRPIAGGIGCRVHNRYHYLQTVFDEESGRFRPGMVLMTINIWRSFMEGHNQVDFMGDYSYKRAWNTSQWLSSDISIRKKLSIEQLAYMGRRYLKQPLKWLHKKIFDYKRHLLSYSPAAVKTSDQIELSEPEVILHEHEIKQVFQLQEAAETCAGMTAECIGKLLPADIEQLIQQRQDSRRQQDWQRADAIRNQLLAEGIRIQDSNDGTTWSYGWETS